MVMMVMSGGACAFGGAPGNGGWGGGAVQCATLTHAHMRRLRLLRRACTPPYTQPTCRDEVSDDRRVALLGGKVQRVHVVLRGCLDVGAVSDQQLDSLLLFVDKPRAVSRGLGGMDGLMRGRWSGLGEVERLAPQARTRSIAKSGAHTAQQAQPCGAEKHSAECGSGSHLCLNTHINIL